MKLEVDLDLLKASFEQLSETPYFRKRVDDFVRHLSGAINHVQSSGSLYDDALKRQFSRVMWRTHQYLAGSTVSESPYEIEYCLSLALSDWVARDCAIATTLSMDIDFHFFPFDILKFIKLSFPTYNDGGFDVILAPMALPRLYKHRPLYCAPLYHEFGHFVDKTYGIAALSLLLSPDNTYRQDIAQSHRAEFFCDLFAAQYVGMASGAYLEEIAAGNAVSATHPSTSDRVKLVGEFLSGSGAGLVGIFQQCLVLLKIPPLEIRYATVDVEAAYDDIRPVTANSPAEVHGLFPATWEYLSKAKTDPNSAWPSRGVNYEDTDRSINDLLEKSIRNRAIVEMWQP